MVVLNALDQTRNQAATMVYALLSEPAPPALLRDGPDLLPRAVEELLRFVPQRNGVGLPRITTAPVEVGDVLMPGGEPVHVSYVAADRDPAAFADPGRLDLTRHEAPHLAFGHGAHYYLGAALTRMQAEVVLSTLLRRLPGLRLAVGPEEVRWLRGTITRGAEALPGDAVTARSRHARGQPSEARARTSATWSRTASRASASSAPMSVRSRASRACSVPASHGTLSLSTS
jgi:cytochrome P450